MRETLPGLSQRVSGLRDLTWNRPTGCEKINAKVSVES